MDYLNLKNPCEERVTGRMSYPDLKINGKTQEHWRSQYSGFARKRFGGHPSNLKKKPEIIFVT